MTDFLVALIATLAGGGIGALAVHRFGVKPLRDQIAAMANTNAINAQALEECRNHLDSTLRLLNNVRDDLVSTKSDLSGCRTRRDELLGQVEGIGEKFKAAAGMVERYYYALTGPAGVGSPAGHLVALFAHFGHDYTPPAEPEPAPTEGE